MAGAHSTRKRLVAQRDLLRKGGAAERASFRTPAEASDMELVTTRRRTAIAQQLGKGAPKVLQTNQACAL